MARPRSPVRTGAFLVVADDGAEFVILGDDVARAAVGAVERLALENPGARVVALRYVSDFLDDRALRTRGVSPVAPGRPADGTQSRPGFRRRGSTPPTGDQESP
jgi:hypothetical protein